MRRWALVILLLAVLTAACGDDNTFLTTTAPSTTQAPETTPPTTVPPMDTTTLPPPPPDSTSSTTSTTSATTTTAPGPFYAVDPAHFFPDAFPGSNGAHGSGCVTPGFDALPDGVWFGFAEGVGGGMITFDLACFFTGPAAEDAAAEDGEVLDGDFYIRNHVATTFPVPIAADARVWYVDALSGDVGSPTEIPLAAWPNPASFQECPGQFCSVWLYVNGGRATGIVEQYLP